jgi:hypothetical protein
MRTGDFLDQSGGGEFELDVDLMPRVAKALEPPVGYCFGYQYSCHVGAA